MFFLRVGKERAFVFPSLLFFFILNEGAYLLQIYYFFFFPLGIKFITSKYRERTKNGA